jgi:hypothetical protein
VTSALMVAVLGMILNVHDCEVLEVRAYAAMRSGKDIILVRS